MSDPIKLLLIKVYQSSLTIVILLILLQLAETAIAGLTDQIKLFPEQNAGIYNNRWVEYIFHFCFAGCSVTLWLLARMSISSGSSLSLAIHYDGMDESRSTIIISPVLSAYD